MEITNREEAPFGIHAVFERIKFPPQGRDGGSAGMAGKLRLGSGVKLKGKGFQVIPNGESLIIEMPGGGGFGDPATRNPLSVEKDVRQQLVSQDKAKNVYRVAFHDALSIAAERTAALRARTTE